MDAVHFDHRIKKLALLSDNWHAQMHNAGPRATCNKHGHTETCAFCQIASCQSEGNSSTRETSVAFCSQTTQVEDVFFSISQLQHHTET